MEESWVGLGWRQFRMMVLKYNIFGHTDKSSLIGYNICKKKKKKCAFVKIEKIKSMRFLLSNVHDLHENKPLHASQTK